MRIVPLSTETAIQLIHHSIFQRRIEQYPQSTFIFIPRFIFCSSQLSIWSFNWQVSACCCLSMRVCLRIHLELQTVRVPVICFRKCVRLQLMTHFAKASLWISFGKTSFSVLAFNMKTPPNPCFTVWHSPFRILLRTCLKHAFLSLLNMLAATKSRICSCLRTASCAARQKNQSALARQIRKICKNVRRMATGDG